MTSSVRKDAVSRISTSVHGSMRRLNRTFATTPEIPQRVAAAMTATYPRNRSFNLASDGFLIGSQQSAVNRRRRLAFDCRLLTGDCRLLTGDCRLLSLHEGLSCQH